MEFVSIAKTLAAQQLPKRACTTERYGMAFVVIHGARLFNQILVDWWERTNELRHHVFKSGPRSPKAFVDITETGEAFCIWELRVLAFERQA